VANGFRQEMISATSITVDHFLVGFGAAPADRRHTLFFSTRWTIARSRTAYPPKILTERRDPIRSVYAGRNSGSLGRTIAPAIAQFLEPISAASNEGRRLSCRNLFTVHKIVNRALQS
jgi:hypothetical protein